MLWVGKTTKIEKYSGNKELLKLLYRGCPSNTMQAILTFCYDKLIEIQDSTIIVDEDSSDIFDDKH